MSFARWFNAQYIYIFLLGLVNEYCFTICRYPVEGYKPLQEVPTLEYSKAIVLCKCLSRLATIYHDVKIKRESDLSNQEPGDTGLRDIDSKLKQCHIGAASGDSKEQTVSQKSKPHKISSQAFWTFAASKVMHHLAPLLKNEYIVDAGLLDLIIKLVDVNEWKTISQAPAQILLDWMWALMQDHEIKPCMDNLICSLLIAYKFAKVEIGYPKQVRTYISRIGKMLLIDLTLKLIRNIPLFCVGVSRYKQVSYTIKDILSLSHYTYRLSLSCKWCKIRIENEIYNSI